MATSGPKTPGGGRRHRSPAARGIAAGLAAAALVAPATSAARPSLVAQGTAAVRQQNASAEAHHKIPFKRGTGFTISCAVRGQDVRCTEHAGPERCVKGRPWLLLSDIFPIIKGRLGESLTYGLVETYIYCPRH